MNILPVPDNEKQRLKALRDYNILDSIGEEEFDRLTELASAICGVPIALVSLIDEDRQWFKAKTGLTLDETPRNISFCQHSIMGDSLFQVEDATQDERFKNTPLVTDGLKIRFYAGQPLIDPEGYALGTLCVIDQQPKQLNEIQRRSLEILAREVVAQIVSRKEKNELENFENLFKVSIDMICVAGTDGYLQRVNPAFINTLGWNEKELMEGTLISFVHPDDVEKTILQLKSITRNESTFNFTCRIKTKGGEYKELQWIGTSDLENQKIYAIARDVTSRVRMEKELYNARIIAEQNAYAKDVFLANMSHEIRTPMNAITGFANLLADTSLDDEQREFVSNINIASGNLLAIINDILDISKIESGHISIEEIGFNVKELITNVHAILKQKSLEAGLDLVHTIDEKIPDFIVGDPTRLNQILLNLINNAIKFTEKGFVEIHAELADETEDNCNILFSVKDTGIGIPADKTTTIFERFTQADTDTTRRFGGTGLGLSICKSLVELQNGTIIVESTLGEGSVFKVSLPFKKMNHEITPQKEFSMKLTDHQKKIKVLLVEDNLLNQKLALKVLQNFGFYPELAENGRIAVERLKTETYDVILMDLQMPEMDGYQATQHIRTVLKINTPIIAMTAHSLVGEKDKCIAVGMNDYIPKPFSPNELFTKITAFANPEEDSEDSLVESAFINDEYLVDLSYLRELSAGNKEFENEMIELFLNQTPLDMKILEDAVNAVDFEKIRTTAHKLKSSFALLGIDEKGSLALMEENAGDAKNIAFIESCFLKLKQVFVRVKVLLKKELE